MAYEKPKQVALEGITEQLDSNLQSLKEIKLLSEGNVLATYNRSGTLIIYNMHSKNVRKVKNDSPIVCMRVFYPHIITVHESNEMQVCRCIFSFYTCFDCSHIYARIDSSDTFNCNVNYISYYHIQ